MAYNHHPDCDGYMSTHRKSVETIYGPGPDYARMVKGQCDCGWKMPGQYKRTDITDSELFRRMNTQHTQSQEVMCDLSCQKWFEN